MMVYYLKKLFLLVLLFSIIIHADINKKFVILIASYNNEQWAVKNIVSAFQNYPETHYRIIYVNDCSTDNTLDLIMQTVQLHNKEHLVTLVNNPVRMGALCNHWNVIHQLVADDEIIVILDGDDLLAGSDVLNTLNELYTSHDIWLTYGQFREMKTKNRGFNRAMPHSIIANNAFRTWQDIPSHLRTFYAKLYKNIKIEHLIINGEFFDMCADMASMIPMIEMARDHFAFISKVLYRYNDTNPISDHKKSVERQRELDRYIRSLPVYEPLEKLF